MSMVDRFLGKRVVEENGHFVAGGGLIVDPSAVAGEGRTSAWDAVQLARDLKRPHSLELIEAVFDKFQELHGDRTFRDDPAIIGGIAELAGVGAVVVVGQQRGADTEGNILRNFGMPYPEGYRKAIGLYRLAG